MTPPPCRGFSLAETLLALAVASSAAVAVIGLLAGALNTALECRRQTAASLLAQRLVTIWTAEATDEILLVDQALQPLLSRREQPAAAESAYADGSSLPAAGHFACIERLPSAMQTGPQRLRLRIESPASAPAGRRQVQTYVTLALP